LGAAVAGEGGKGSINQDWVKVWLSSACNFSSSKERRGKYRGNNRPSKGQGTGKRTVGKKGVGTNLYKKEERWFKDDYLTE